MSCDLFHVNLLFDNIIHIIDIVKSYTEKRDIINGGNTWSGTDYVANWYYFLNACFHEKNDKLSFRKTKTLIIIVPIIFREIQNHSVNQSYIFEAFFLPTASEDMFEICNGTREDRINSIQDKI